MRRQWKPHDFDSTYECYICQDDFRFGGRDYYLRYRSRYKECIKRFAELVPSSPVDVLDIGGGQLALMCNKLWQDRGVAADLPAPHLDYIASQVSKHSTGIYANLSRLSMPSSTSSFFLKSSSTFRYPVTSCCGGSLRFCGPAEY